MTIDPVRVFKAMGHCWPMDTFTEEEVRELASSLGADANEAWTVYEAALAEAQDEAPPGPVIG